MKTLTLQSSKTNFYSTILRVAFGMLGLFYLIPALDTFFSTYELNGLTVLQGLSGIFILAWMTLNPTFGANIKLSLNDTFIRTREDMELIRTAYWNKIDRLTLTRYSIRIKYKSGVSERFRLPFVSNDEHDQLKKWLQQISHEHTITLTEKAWWKIF